MVSEAQKKLAHYIASQGVWSYNGVIKLMEARKNGTVTELKEVARIAGISCSFPNDRTKPEHDNHPYYFARLVKDQEVGKFADALWAWVSRHGNSEAMSTVKEMSEQLVAKGIQPEATTEQKIAWKQDFHRYMEDRVTLCTKGDPYVS